MNARILPAGTPPALRFLGKVSDDFWWDIARRCEYATFFHTPIWLEIADRIWPHHIRNETFGAILPNGVRVVFPIVSTRRVGPFRRLESTAMGCYGGPIADGPVSPTEAVEIYRHAIALTTASVYFRANPLHPPPSEVVNSLFTLADCEVNCALLLDSDFETIFSHFSRTQRNAYRKGVRNGVQIRLADSLDDYRAFHVNYLDAAERWGNDKNNTYSLEQWEQVYLVSRTYPEQIKLWLMIVDKRVVGGRFVFYWGQQAAGWQGTAHRDYLDYDVMPVADTEIIRDAIRQGYRYFNFGISSHKKGVIDYKLRFAPKLIPEPLWCFRNPMIEAARVARRRILLREPKRKPAVSCDACPTKCSERLCGTPG